MKKKLICFMIIGLISILFINISYATDILMDLPNNNAQNSSQLIDNTTYTSDDTFSTIQDMSEISQSEQTPAVTTTTDYDDSTELSVSNMINIILIAVGVVLILLGIAIIIKLK